MATVGLQLKRVLNKTHNHVQNTVLPLGILVQLSSEPPLPNDMSSAHLGGPVGGPAATGILPN
jgi:hypothetical protein